MKLSTRLLLILLPIVTVVMVLYAAWSPPPRGLERRSRDRLILELAGLGLGAIAAAADAATRRLSPADALWELARQPSVIAHEVGNPLAVALGNVDLTIDGLRGATSLEPKLRATLLEDLANASEGIGRLRTTSVRFRIARLAARGAWGAST